MQGRKEGHKRPYQHHPPTTKDARLLTIHVEEFARVGSTQVKQ
jgi:hypothetical protein